MREYLFRGKRLDNNEWVYGYLLKIDNGENKAYIMPKFASVVYYYEVAPETVGQYTGLKDKNGVKIYKGDIVLYFSKYKYMVCFGEYNKNPKHCAEAIIVGFYLKEINTGAIEELYSINGYGAKFPAHCAESELGAENFKLEVIGNTWEDSDLINDCE